LFSIFESVGFVDHDGINVWRHGATYVFLELFWSWISIFLDGGFSNVKGGVLPSFMKLGRISNGLCGYAWLPLKMALNLLCIFINILLRWTTREELVKMDSMKILTKLLVHFLLMFVCMKIG
jgi:hypothetical protein